VLSSLTTQLMAPASYLTHCQMRRLPLRYYWLILERHSTRRTGSAGRLVRLGISDSSYLLDQELKLWQGSTGGPGLVSSGIADSALDYFNRY